MNDSIKILTLLFLSLQVYSACPCLEQKNIITSPDRNVSVLVGISENKNAFYTVKHGDKLLIGQSRLDIIREDEDFSENFSLDSASNIQVIKDDYEILAGKKKRCSYLGNRKTFHFSNKNGEVLFFFLSVYTGKIPGIQITFYQRDKIGNLNNRW
ncbi:glycoside hydrolase family 97 N-terminal domain-containing protein [candidate division WOR-3 bacterium]|nr:glycoside hydrolase family 97 N-terminal domain-containing protein [candidate division WOR-3 bacterium]